MTFDVQYSDSSSNARVGVITTDHGQILTPIFMPVGTKATIKGMILDLLQDKKYI